MERQSEQELLAIAPVETESLEGNRIYQVTGRELTQIAEISAREAVKMCREERKKTEKREQSNADKVKRTKKLLSDYRRLKREIPEKEEFTESEKVEKRWAFLRDLMGSAHINSQESVVEKEEKLRAENMYYLNRIDVPGGVRNIEKARSYAVLQGSVRILHSGGRKDGCSDCE